MKKEKQKDVGTKKIGRTRDKGYEKQMMGVAEDAPETIDRSLAL